ncbi:hypothetical protein TIFTF001_031568 [Ficus carica]|uniref:Uncharacterized protein n=1 Tax=Ficus carica TaxID=3494 RepID=A0AA88DV87_FICCA|nr:hypothetical protein TIFTF001_031568 [Ficus carica]
MGEGCLHLSGSGTHADRGRHTSRRALAKNSCPDWRVWLTDSKGRAEEENVAGHTLTRLLARLNGLYGLAGRLLRQLICLDRPNKKIGKKKKKNKVQWKGPNATDQSNPI